MITTLHPLTATSAETDAPNVWRRPAMGLLILFGGLTLFATLEKQPSPSDRFGDWAGFVTTDRFLVGHVAGSIVGQAVFLLAATAIAAAVLRETRRPRHVVAGFVLAVLGSAGLLAGFGTAAFAQPAIGRLELAGDPGAHALYDDVYRPITFVTLIGGAVAFAVGTVLLAAAVAATPGARRAAAWAFAVSAPLIGVVGIALGPAQTVGSIAAVVAGLTLFRRSAGAVGQASSTAASGVPRNAASRSASPSMSART